MVNVGDVSSADETGKLDNSSIPSARPLNLILPALPIVVE